MTHLLTRSARLGAFLWCLCIWNATGHDGNATSATPLNRSHSAVLAQLPNSGPPPFRRSTGKPAGLTPEIETFLTKLIATYQQAQSYRDRGRVTLVQRSGRVKTTTEMPMELAFRRPNHLLLDAGHYTLASDGKTLYFAVPGLGQYTATPTPEKLEKKHLQVGTVLGGSDEGHPELIDLLLLPDAYTVLVSQMTRIGWGADVVVEERPCRVLSYETTQDTKVKMFVEAQRMVILKVEAETIATPAGPGGAPVSPAASPMSDVTTLSYQFAPVEINRPIDDAVFAFKPAAGLRRVAAIGSPGSDAASRLGEAKEQASIPEGAHILGKPAPALSGKDLKGKPISMTELRGKVVLLFFWDLGGGEYSLISIPTVQRVADRFADRPEVVVLGVNGDDDQPETVVQLMERKKATFRTLVDEGQRLQGSYELGGLPTFVLIGQDGTVKWAKLGAPPSLQNDLVLQIEKLLADVRK